MGKKENIIWMIFYSSNYYLMLCWVMLGQQVKPTKRIFFNVLLILYAIKFTFLCIKQQHQHQKIMPPSLPHKIFLKLGCYLFLSGIAPSYLNYLCLYIIAIMLIQFYLLSLIVWLPIILLEDLQLNNFTQRKFQGKSLQQHWLMAQCLPVRNLIL